MRADPRLRGRLTTPQAIAREMTVDVDHPTLGPLRTLGTPIKMSATPLNPKRRGPMLGEHTDDVLAEAGYSSDEIEQLALPAPSADRAASAFALTRFGETSYWTPAASRVDHNVVITVFRSIFPHVSLADRSGQQFALRVVLSARASRVRRKQRCLPACWRCELERPLCLEHDVS